MLSKICCFMHFCSFSSIKVTVFRVCAVPHSLCTADFPPLIPGTRRPPAHQVCVAAAELMANGTCAAPRAAGSCPANTCELFCALNATARRSPSPFLLCAFMFRPRPKAWVPKCRLLASRCRLGAATEPATIPCSLCTLRVLPAAPATASSACFSSAPLCPPACLPARLLSRPPACFAGLPAWLPAAAAVASSQPRAGGRAQRA